MDPQTILSRFYTKDEITSCSELTPHHHHHNHHQTHDRYDDASSVVLNLQEVELWHKFNHVTNEMIVTKSGR